MSAILKEIIKNKIKQLSKNELLSISKQYGFTLSTKEAEEVILYIKQHEFDVFSKKDISVLYEKLSEITNKSTANKAKKLLEQFITDYGLAHHFY